MFFKRPLNEKDGICRKSDEEILELSIHHPAAFEELVRRYYHVFLKKAVRILGDEDDACDAVQETFIKLYKNAHTLERQNDNSFRSWAYTILINTCLSFYRKRTREHSMSLRLNVVECALCEYIPDKVDVQKEKEARDYIDTILARMPSSFSTLLRLHFLEGWKYKELAGREGVSVGALKARMHRAKKEFKRVARLLQ